MFNQLSRGFFRPAGAGRMLAAHGHRLPGACMTLWNHTGWSPAFSQERKWLQEYHVWHSHSSWRKVVTPRARGSTGDRIPETCRFHRQGGPAVCPMGLEASGMVNRTVFRAGSLTQVFGFGVWKTCLKGYSKCFCQASNLSSEIFRKRKWSTCLRDQDGNGRGRSRQSA